MRSVIVVATSCPLGSKAPKQPVQKITSKSSALSPAPFPKTGTSFSLAQGALSVASNPHGFPWLPSFCKVLTAVPVSFPSIVKNLLISKILPI